MSLNFFFKNIFTTENRLLIFNECLSSCNNDIILYYVRLEFNIHHNNNQYIFRKLLCIINTYNKNINILLFYIKYKTIININKFKLTNYNNNCIELIYKKITSYNDVNLFKHWLDIDFNMHKNINKKKFEIILLFITAYDTNNIYNYINIKEFIYLLTDL